MRLLRLRHRHRGRVISPVVELNIYADRSRSDVPMRIDTQVTGVCEKCGQPFVVTYKGADMPVSAFKGVILREPGL